MKKIILIIFVVLNMISYSQNLKSYSIKNKSFQVGDTVVVGFPNGTHYKFAYIHETNYRRLDLYSNDKLIIEGIKRKDGIVYFETKYKKTHYIIQIELAVKSDEIIF